jgi:hypothetical protein
LNISDEKELINSIKDELNNEVLLDSIEYSDSETERFAKDLDDRDFTNYMPDDLEIEV